VTTNRVGTLIILACHGVYDPSAGTFYGEHIGDLPVYLAQLFYALQHVIWRAAAAALLVISGGLTKAQRRCPESVSYLEWAQSIGLVLPPNVATEDYSLTTPENLLLSLYTFKKIRGAYPDTIEFISWEFKRERVLKTLSALNKWGPLGQSWPGLSFFPVGDLSGDERLRALKKEAQYCAELDQGIEAYYASKAVQETVHKRDVFDSRGEARKVYADYPLPF
jgi:hypothetical protein